MDNIIEAIDKARAFLKTPEGNSYYKAVLSYYGSNQRALSCVVLRTGQLSKYEDITEAVNALMQLE